MGKLKKEKIIKIWINDLITKPIHPNLLFGTMSKWITPSNTFKETKK